MKRCLLALLIALLLAPALSAKTLYRAKSLYRDFYVVEESNLLCLKFAIPKKQDTNQSCKDLTRPDALVFSYTQLILSGLFLVPEPDNVLVVGLGGGSLPAALSDLYPQADIVTVEIDPAIAKVAREYFEFEESDKNRVVVRDARLFIKREALKGRQYDFVILDAFGSDYIPEHLTTLEFLGEVKQLLSERGVVAANTFSSSRLYHHESATYAEAFGQFLELRSEVASNRIILAAKSPALLSMEAADRHARSLAPRLAKYGVDALQSLSIINAQPVWDESARLLTDQYSPANLLDGRP